MTTKKKQKIVATTTEEVLILAIAANEKIHKLVWAINNELNINLKISHRTDLELFEYIGDKYFKLVANQKDGGIFFHEIKNIDFIIKIVSENIYETKTDIIPKLKNIPFVTGVFEINITDNKKNQKIFSNSI